MGQVCPQANEAGRSPCSPPLPHHFKPAPKLHRQLLSHVHFARIGGIRVENNSHIYSARLCGIRMSAAEHPNRKLCRGMAAGCAVSEVSSVWPGGMRLHVGTLPLMCSYRTCPDLQRQPLSPSVICSCTIFYIVFYTEHIILVTSICN